MEKEPQRPDLSKQEKKEQKEIIESIEEMQNISPEELEKRVQVGVEKERKKLIWNNLNAGTKANVWLTGILIITAIGALIFQWLANNTTKENLDLIKQEFELTYRPYVSVDYTKFNLQKDSLNIEFIMKNIGNIPAVVKIDASFTIRNDNNKIVNQFEENVLFPGQGQTLNLNRSFNNTDKNFEIHLFLYYKDHISEKFRYTTKYNYLVDVSGKNLNILNVSAN